MVDVLFLHAAPSDLDALGRAFAEGVAAPGLGSIASLLEEEELARARRFRRPADVAEHVFARALVRVALSTVERGIAPSAWPQRLHVGLLARPERDREARGSP